MALEILVPQDYLLHRDVCSYGYFRLAPNLWIPETQTLSRILDLPGGPVSLEITQPPRGGRGEAGLRGKPLRVLPSRGLDAAERSAVFWAMKRMLRLDESKADLRAFHKVDPRWKASGRGRVFRSPTLFEDVVKTVTSCNVTWPSTVGMNRRLCEVMGRRSPGGGFAFPTVEKLARAKAVTLRSRCRVGYRDTRIVELARLFRKGEVDEAWLRDPATDDEAVFKFLKSLPGIGPYAAGNIMQLLGRYSRLALDSESLRHARAVLKMEGTDAELMKRLAGHYEPFGRHKFRSYWFEVWAFYESRKGPAHTWDKVTTGSSFTAANLK